VFFVVISKKEEFIMELSKELKEKVENAKSAEEAKKILKDAGLELTDAELDQVAGGAGRPWNRKVS